jgi:hypothetical protein
VRATDILDTANRFHQGLRRCPLYFEQILDVPAGPSLRFRVLNSLADLMRAVGPGNWLRHQKPPFWAKIGARRRCVFHILALLSRNKSTVFWSHGKCGSSFAHATQGRELTPEADTSSSAIVSAQAS